MKNNKHKYLYDLHVVINLIELTENHFSSILKFLYLIEDEDYIIILNKKKKHIDYEVNFSRGMSYRESVYYK